VTFRNGGGSTVSVSATGFFQDRQRKVLNYPVVLRMESGQLFFKWTKMRL
jgi:hypothetical protein